MRDHSSHKEVSRDEAVELLLGAAQFDRKIETVALGEALGRVLARDAITQSDMPNCLTCRMDSVAVHWADFENGMPDTSDWKRGVQWQFANTGIGMPEGFDTAIVIEHVKLNDDATEISFDVVPSAQYAGTVPAGSRMHKGDVLVQAGSRLTPLLVSCIASGNNAQADVIARPKVAFIPTGNELVTAGSTLARGNNVETNGFVVSGKLDGWGAEPLLFDIVPDDPEKIKQAVLDACGKADIVVLNAGSSKGSDDWNVEMLEEVGEILYHQTNHGPGHHCSGAVVNGVPVVGISGPAGGISFTTDFYVRPLVMRYLNQDVEPVRVSCVLAENFPQGKGGPRPRKAPQHGEDRPLESGAHHRFFGVKQLRVSQREDGTLIATPAGQGLPNPVVADSMNAYYLLDTSEGATPPQAGDTIEVELRD